MIFISFSVPPCRPEWGNGEEGGRREGRGRDEWNAEGGSGMEWGKAEGGGEGWKGRRKGRAVQDSSLGP